jgi:hypothetical protein
VGRRDRWNRGIDYRRINYRPQPMSCPCASCRSWRSDPDLRELLFAGRPNPSCRYVNPERCFAEAWEEENRSRPGINYGMGILQDLMVTQREAKAHEWGVRDHFRFLRWLRVAFVVTPRERVIVATVIQWLGTNVGFAWLCQVLDRSGYKVCRKEEARAESA